MDDKNREDRKAKINKVLGAVAKGLNALAKAGEAANGVRNAVNPDRRR